MNITDLEPKELKLHLLESNLETLENCFSTNPDGCLILVDTLHDIQKDYEDEGEFECGRVVSEYRNKIFQKGQQMLVDQRREL